jgi:hypothetical protein
MNRPTKITFGDMRDMGVLGILIYCSDYKCSHSIATSADRRTPPVGHRAPVCQACGKRGADVRPDFNWNRQPASIMDPLKATGGRDLRIAV